MAAARKKSTSISDEHLEALANGRSEGTAIRKYLTALETHKPKRGRKRSPESMKKRLSAIDQELKKADPLTRLLLTQEKMDLDAALASEDDFVDMKALEEAFVKAAKGYATRKKISYAAWREAGVDAAVLKRAGIERTR